MTTRLTRDEALMECAMVWQKRSTCLRLRVGAIVAREGRVLVTGYNGAPTGQEHCHPKVCGTENPCTRTVHAEANCIAFAAKYGIALAGGELYTTDSPCKNCAELIANAGIIRVVYLRPYRDLAPMDLLQSCGVRVESYAG